jgi:hypothetical protein
VRVATPRNENHRQVCIEPNEGYRAVAFKKYVLSRQSESKTRSSQFGLVHVSHQPMDGVTRDFSRIGDFDRDPHNSCE